MSLVAGVPGNLTCRSRGDAQPAPELLWFRDGIRLDGTTFHQVSLNLFAILWSFIRLRVHFDHRLEGMAAIQG